MRGKVKISNDGYVTFRITPAYAGKSYCVIISYFGYRDHPRLCGEKISGFAVILIVLGSPPPMRGKGRGKTCQLWRLGITPAYAGKSPYLV